MLLPLDLKSVNNFKANGEHSNILNVPFHVLRSIATLFFFLPREKFSPYTSNSITVEHVCCFGDKLITLRIVCMKLWVATPQVTAQGHMMAHSARRRGIIHVTAVSV